MSETTIADAVRLNGNKIEGVNKQDLRRLLAGMSSVRLSVIMAMNNGELAEYMAGRCSGDNALSAPLAIAEAVHQLAARTTGGGKYRINLDGASNVQIGHGNTQHNHW